MTKKMQYLYTFAGVSILGSIAIKVASNKWEAIFLGVASLIALLLIVREFLSTECTVVDQVDENADEPKEILEIVEDNKDSKQSM